jgi:hypothetical protein
MTGEGEDAVTGENASAFVPGLDRDLLVEVHPGAGVVDRHEDSLLVIPMIGQLQWPHVRQLLDICERRPDATGRGRARAIAALLTEAEPDEVPGFALMLGTDAEVTVLVQGDVDVTARGIVEHSFTGAGSLTWVERRIGGLLEYLQVVASGARPVAVISSAPFHLVEGTVPGSGVTVHRGRSDIRIELADDESVPVSSGPETAAARTPATVTSPPSAGPLTTVQETVARPAYQFESVLLSELSDQSPERRGPLPLEEVDAPDALPQQQESVLLVEGVECSSGHFNDPAAEQCATCGVALQGPPQHKVTGPRPALGVLVTDDGSVFSVTGDYVIGRAPERDEAVLSGSAKAMVLRDVGKSVSRVHAHLTVSGWQVRVVDRGSSNGTFVSRSGQAGPWERLSEDAATPLAPGARLRIGGRQLLFERYHEGNSPRTGG